MKKILTFTSFLIIVIITINHYQYKKNKDIPLYNGYLKINENILIIELEDTNYKIKDKGIYSLIHIYPRKTIKDLYFDLKKNNDVTIMNPKDFIKQESKPISPIILLEKVKINELERIKNLKKTNTSIIVLSLNKQVNIMFIESDINSLIHSSTTKRKGFVKYTDLINIINERLVFDYFSIQYIDDPYDKLQAIYKKYILLCYSRYIILIFIFLQFILFLLSKKNKILFQYYIFLPQLLSSILGLTLFNNLNGINKSIIIIITSLIIGATLYYKNFDYQYSMIIILYSNLLFLLYYTFFKIFLYQSPIGFNNIFNGNRFYGLNNDLIGIFIGSVLGITYISDINKKNKPLALLISMLVIFIICFSPLYGANIGGMLNCLLSIIILSIFLESSNYKRIIYILFSLIIFIILQKFFISYDSQQKLSTHLASFVTLIKNNEFLIALQIIYTKINQVILFLIIPPLNIFLFLELLIIFKDKNIKGYDKLWRNVFFFISLSIILLNDSGLLSAIIMLFYFVCPYIIKNNIFLTIKNN
ncbi:MAG: hypothetical protein GX327_07370 [Epulopiscium sp.]|nr:hypothetical protein [Candidatus Epulonipiscium sp.]